MNYTHLLFLWIIYFVLGFSIWQLQTDSSSCSVPLQCVAGCQQLCFTKKLNPKLSKGCQSCSFFSCTDAVPFSVGDLTKCSSDTTFFSCMKVDTLVPKYSSCSVPVAQTVLNQQHQGHGYVWLQINYTMQCQYNKCLDFSVTIYFFQVPLEHAHGYTASLF